MKDQFESILGKLPLDQCSWKRSEVTNEWSWLAPVNYTFRVTGRFEILGFYTDNIRWPMPQPSLQKLILEHRQTYAQCLKNAQGDRRQARELFIEELNDDGGDGYAAPTYFEGKCLVIAPNFDGSKSNFDYQVGSPDHPLLYVKSKPLVWVNNIGLTIMKDPHPDAKEDQAYAFPLFNGDVVWGQDYVRVEEGVNRVRMVKRVEPKPKFYVPKSLSGSESGLITPVRRMGTQGYVQYHEAVYGQPPTDAQLTAKMREYRAAGIPLEDDPLKDFVLPSPFGPRIIRPIRPKVLTPRDLRDDKNLEF